MSTRVQDNVDKQRKHLEDQIKRMQVSAHRDTSGKSNGQIASRKKKLARHGYEKNIHGHKFNAQHEATAGRSTMRAGSQCGKFVTFTLFSNSNLYSILSTKKLQWDIKLVNQDV